MPHHVAGAASRVEHHAGHLVPHDGGMVVHAEPPRAFAADPDACDGYDDRHRRAIHKPNGATASPNSSPTTEPNVPGATGARPEPKPSASRCTGSRSSAAGTGMRSRFGGRTQEAKWS